jgi:hypothetical protein
MSCERHRIYPVRRVYCSLDGLLIHDSDINTGTNALGGVQTMTFIDAKGHRTSTPLH